MKIFLYSLEHWIISFLNEIWPLSGLNQMPLILSINLKHWQINKSWSNATIGILFFFHIHISSFPNHIFSWTLFNFKHNSTLKEIKAKLSEAQNWIGNVGNCHKNMSCNLAKNITLSYCTLVLALIDQYTVKSLFQAKKCPAMQFRGREHFDHASFSMFLPWIVCNDGYDGIMTNKLSHDTLVLALIDQDRKSVV